MTDYECWRTVDFRPAPPGWAIIHLLSATSCTRHPLVGWLIEEDSDGDRRVVAADIGEDGEVSRAFIGRWNTSGWYVVGPGEPDPTPEEMQAEWSQRQDERREHMARLKCDA